MVKDYLGNDLRNVVQDRTNQHWPQWLRQIMPHVSNK
jgi:hypothetical protein